jgi:hypothetical protein
MPLSILPTLPREVLPRDVRGRCPVLPVARIVEHEHALGVRRRERVGEELRDPLLGHGLRLPTRLRQEELQALRRGALGTRPRE